MLGASVGKFQIPNLYGEEPSLGLTVDGVSTFPSQNLNENQREVTEFAALSWQHSQGAFDVQSSVIARYSSLTFVPDPLGDLLYDGISQDAFKQNVAYARRAMAPTGSTTTTRSGPACFCSRIIRSATRPPKSADRSDHRRTDRRCAGYDRRQWFGDRVDR